MYLRCERATHAQGLANPELLATYRVWFRKTMLTGRDGSDSLVGKRESTFLARYVEARGLKKRSLSYALSSSISLSPPDTIRTAPSGNSIASCSSMSSIVCERTLAKDAARSTPSFLAGRVNLRVDNDTPTAELICIYSVSSGWFLVVSVFFVVSRVLDKV
ncbi:unnamed protein product [Pleuronectes platessa]|uniref:Uncharacterized protein n=1 Tax=Pleuronectes platessa TaxID=8262 RepID=A0A9N7TW93_PLEPL|nr:unnamed protein product [Pleuronectes platessa]